MIKNIVFDFGDIFINLDKEATLNQLFKLGVTAFPEDFFEKSYQYEKGEISTEQFLSFLSDAWNISVPKLKSVWNAILLDFPIHRFSFLKELATSNKYRLFLLSNTNDMHITWIQEHWGAALYAEFKNCF